MKKNFLVAIVGIFTIIPVWITFTHIDWFSQVQEIVRTSGVCGYAIFVVAYAIATLLILPVTAFNIAGGALYGGMEGLLLTSAGALISALMGFILARSLGSKLIATNENWSNGEFSSSSNISKNLVKGGVGYAFAARLFPLIPYGVVSLIAGLSPLKRRDYLVGTLLGTPLGIAPFVFLGSTGVQVSASHDLLPLLASSMGLAVLVVAGTWYASSSKDQLAQDDYAESPE